MWLAEARTASAAGSNAPSASRSSKKRTVSGPAAGPVPTFPMSAATVPLICSVRGSTSSAEASTAVTTRSGGIVEEATTTVASSLWLSAPSLAVRRRS